MAQQPSSKGVAQPLLAGSDDRGAQETSQADEQNKVANLQLCLKLVFCLVLLLGAKIMFFSGHETDFADARIKQLEMQISGLEELWSWPETRVLNEKYSKLHAALESDSTEVQKIDQIHSEFHDVKTTLTQVQTDVTEMHTFQANETVAIAGLGKTIREMESYRKEIDTKLHDGMEKISSDAVAIAQQEIGPAVTDMRGDIVINKKRSADALQNALVIISSSSIPG